MASLVEDEDAFWVVAFLAAIASGKSAQNAAFIATEAAQIYAEEFSDEG